MNVAQAKQWCRQKQYDRVIAMYAQELACLKTWKPWDYYYYAYSLSKQKRYAEGREISRQCILAFPDFMPIRDIYCWCLYYLYVYPFVPGRNDIRAFQQAVDSIAAYGQQTSRFPYERAIWKMIEVLRKQKRASPAQIDKYVSKLNPDLLPSQPQPYVKDGEWLSQASYRERWYALKSSLLIKLEQYKNCIAVCEEGLRIFPEFHYDNDIWLRYRIALCHLRMGKTNQAAQELHALLQYKRHWIVYRGLFYAAQEEGSQQHMRRYGAAAFLQPGDMADKARFLVEFADSLSQEDWRTERALHYALALRIRQEQGWFISDMLRERAATYEGQVPDQNTLLRHLQSFWIRCCHKGDEEKRGFISSVLPGGKAGFIKEYGGSSYYFKSDSLLGMDAEKGTAVSFFVQVGLDRFDGKASQRAVHIRKKEDLF